MILTVSAVGPRKERASLAEPWLAALLALTAPELGSVSGKLTAVTASGGMFRMLPAGLRPGGAPADPVLTVGAARLTKPLSSLLALCSGERYAMTSGAGYDANRDLRSARAGQAIPLAALSPRELSAPPGAFAGGVLAPGVNGQVFLLDPLARQDMLAQPYATSLKGVTTWEWRTPQAVDDKLAVLVRRRSPHDRNAPSPQGDEPTLTEAAVAQLSKRQLLSPIAVLGKSVYVVDDSDKLLSFALPDLSPGKIQSLAGHCVWGPQRVGNFVLVATDKNQLIAINEQQQVAWQAELELRFPVGLRRGVQYRQRHLSRGAKRHCIAHLGRRRQGAGQSRCRLSLGLRPAIGRRAADRRRA